MDYVAKIYNYTGTIKGILNTEGLDVSIDTDRHVVVAVEDAEDYLDTSDYEVINWTGFINSSIACPPPRGKRTK